MNEHLNPNVAAAIVRLNDALCMWERSTGRQSVLIIREEGWSHRSCCGKPGIPDDVTDSMLLATVSPLSPLKAALGEALKPEL